MNPFIVSVLAQLGRPGCRSSSPDSSSSSSTRLAAATRYNQLDVSSPSNGLGAIASSAGAKSISVRTINAQVTAVSIVFTRPYAASADRRWIPGWRLLPPHSKSLVQCALLRLRSPGRPLPPAVDRRALSLLLSGEECVCACGLRVGQKLSEVGASIQSWPEAGEKQCRHAKRVVRALRSDRPTVGRS